ncbi:hypothetical protein AUC43_19755 [Hymenobacter sedentarius]|uniref:Glycosyltransferase 2-like domain-containing protein n=1 Tax=Hymenobacter sedentarius TaxID=1411621 RepID=A0A0U4CFZ8_9BACT|nr:hypothetical protein AUC43_19755 [Hymenobacter sedentarius]
MLVDNASTDNTTELARQAWELLAAPAALHLLHEPRPGKQYALETAIGQAQYRYTCIVDDDNRLSITYLREGLTILEKNPKVGILGGPSTATFEGPEPVWFAEFQHCYAVGPQLDRVGGAFKPLAEGNIGRNVLWGAGMFVRMAVWEQLHEAGFQSLFSGRQGDGNLTAGEDDELCYAAQLLGYEVWYSSRLHLQHHIAAGRLTEAYRDRLFYASARTSTRLNAYRNALWGKPGGSVALNLLKDVAYSTLGLTKEAVSPSLLRALVAANTIVPMKLGHTFASLKETVLNFERVKSYYKHVLQLKSEIASHKLNHRQ